MSRSIRKPWLIVSAHVVVLALALSAQARPGAADKFDEGLRAFKRGAHAEAAKAFYAAHRAHPHPDALYNAGLAWELAGEPGPAATAYAWALALELPEKARRDAQKRLDRLASVLGRVEVAAPEGSTVRAPPFTAERASVTLYFEPGRQRIEVELPSGASVVRAVVVSAGKTDVLLVELADEPKSKDEVRPRPRPARAEKKVAVDEGESDRTVGWVALGAAGAASGAAIVLGLQALGARDDYNASGHRDVDARDRAESLRLWTNVAWGAAAVLGATGGFFLLMSPDASGDPSASVSGAFVSGTF